MMSAKKKLWNAINGRPVEKVSWSPFLAYYWDFLPEEVKAEGQLKYMEGIGSTPLLRGMVTPFTIRYKNCEFIEVTEGIERIQTYTTNLGTLTLRYTYNGDTWFLVEHGVKNKEDLEILTYICENLSIEADIDAVNKCIEEVGERGLVVPRIGLFGKSSFQSLLEHWIGTQNLIYAIMDYPDAIDQCLLAMGKKSREVAIIAAQTKAQIFLSWEDTSTTNISPAYYEKYIRPEIDEWCDILHDKDKRYIQHACGHLKHLLPYMAKSKIDGIESMSPKPTGDVDVLEAIEILPENMVLIGGLEPVFLVNADEEALKDRIYHLLDGMKNRRFILANSDSCPPEVTQERLKLISEITRVYNSERG